MWKKSAKITLLEFTVSFVPFALLVSAALFAAETSLDPSLYRTIYTIWVTAILVTPALCAFILLNGSPVTFNVWLLFWTFSFAAYLVHLAYAVFGAYHGSFSEIVAGQGIFPLVNNVVFTVWWTLDVALAWFHAAPTPWIRKQRIAAHVYIGGTFIISTVVLKHGFINVLGVALTAAVVISFLIRFSHASRPHHAA